jgi:hypothetical protein
MKRMKVLNSRKKQVLICILLSCALASCSAFQNSLHLSRHYTAAKLGSIHPSQHPYQPQHSHPSQTQHLPKVQATNLLASPTTIHGLVPDFERACQVDATLENLQKQLPQVLTKPLTAVSADRVYAKDFSLVVVVAEGPEEEEFTLATSREDLVSLSDVIVLATTAAQRASQFLGNSDYDYYSRTQVSCQLLLDDSFQKIRIPWKTNLTTAFGGGATGTTTPAAARGIEGLSEFILSPQPDGKCKVQKHRLLNVTLNGNVMNGPAIGQALRTLKSFNLQQSPIFQSMLGGTSIFNDLRDGILEQAAEAASNSINNVKDKKNGQQQQQQQQIITDMDPPPVIFVRNLENTTGWVRNQTAEKRDWPYPGTKEWKEYTIAHKSLTTFLDQVLQVLSGADRTREITPQLFSPTATYYGVDGSLLMERDESIATFYKSLVLARKGTGGTWTLTNAVVDWKNRTATIDYQQSNSLPPWTVQGRDIYYLDPLCETPIIEKIEQVQLSISNQDGSIKMDHQWFMRNLVGAIERGRFAGGERVRDIVAELLLQQGPSKALSSKTKEPSFKLSESAAARVFYIMSDLHRQVDLLLSESGYALPPAIEYMTDKVELRGYLGEALVKGATLYNRVVGLMISSLNQAVTRKTVVVVKKVPPRVELTPAGNVRLYLTLQLRVPPPGGLFADATQAGVPLKLELVSDYIIDSSSGKISQHRLVESRVNGQLTPGDVMSRSIQRYLNLDSATSTTDGGDDPLKTFSDALAWVRSMGSR